MAPDQARAIEKAMAGMTKQQQKDFMEMQVFGTVVNKTGAIMMATNKGYSASVSELDEKARNSSLTLEEVAKTNSKFREQTLADRKAGTALGMATMGSGAFADTSAAINEQLQAAAKQLTPEDLAKQIATQVAAAKTRDDLTNKFLETEKAYQDSMVKLQSIAIDNMQIGRAHV